MARYIDADALKAKYYALYHHGTMAVKSVLPVFANLLDNQPTADVTEVVRCKDCIYWQDNNGGYIHEGCKWGNEETPDADDFCSCGERKEDR